MKKTAQKPYLSFGPGFSFEELQEIKRLMKGFKLIPKKTNSRKTSRSTY